MIYDAIVIGGGAAGLFCALTAGKRGKKVLVIEHNSQVGRKIIISGGGRCNFTNLNTQPDNFVSQNPHFCKSALVRYTPHDFIALVKNHNIAFYEKTLGQLFCRDSSRQIVDMLLRECRAANVEIRTGTAVKAVRKTPVGESADNAGFSVSAANGSFLTKCIVVACGGLSFPKIGATDMGYRVARQFGIEVTETRPSLVALVFKGQDRSRLAGISLDAVVKAGKQSFREKILFTHRGLSGPAILQASNYWEIAKPISIDLAPDIAFSEIVSANRRDRRNLGNFLATLFPQRFADELAKSGSGNKPLYQMNDSERQTLVDAICNWRVDFSETEGYDRAEVTLGGVSTGELSSQTMEAKRVPGLFFIGEVVDVTGWLGGYNFQWAWSSGHAAGMAI